MQRTSGDIQARSRSVGLADRFKSIKVAEQPALSSVDVVRSHTNCSGTSPLSIPIVKKGREVVKMPFRLGHRRNSGCPINCSARSSFFHRPPIGPQNTMTQHLIDLSLEAILDFRRDALDLPPHRAGLRRGPPVGKDALLVSIIIACLAGQPAREFCAFQTYVLPSAAAGGLHRTFLDSGLSPTTGHRWIHSPVNPPLPSTLDLTLSKMQSIQFVEGGGMGGSQQIIRLDFPTMYLS